MQVISGFHRYIAGNEPLQAGFAPESEARIRFALILSQQDVSRGQMCDPDARAAAHEREEFGISCMKEVAVVRSQSVGLAGGSPNTEERRRLW